MLKLLNEIVLFFRRERVYFFLLLFVGVCYVLILADPYAKHKAQTESSEEVEAFKTAEEKFDRKMSSEESYRDFVRQKPVLATLFQSMTVLFVLALLAGLILDILFLLKPSWRRNFTSGAPPPQAKPWPFSILFKTVLLFLVSGILLSVGLGIVHVVIPKFGSENLYMILHTFFLDVLCVVFMVTFLKQQGSHWRELGFRVPEGKAAREVGAGFMTYLGILPVFVLVLVILFVVANLFHYEPPPHPLVNVFLEEEKRQPFLVVFSVLLGVVIGPVFEEIFFRGFCYPILKGKIGKFWAMAASSAFFAGIHYSGFAFWPIFVLGMGLAWLYETRKTLISPIVLHVTHNAVFISYFFLVKQVIGWTAA